MAKQKSIVILPQLKDCGGDLSKTWFVEYSCRNPQTEEMKRFRVYNGFAKLKTKEERYAFAEKIINEIKEKFTRGEIPFLGKEVSYNDELLYQNIAKRWGNERKGSVGIRTYLSDFLAIKKVEVIPHSFQTYKSKLRIFCEWVEQTGLDKQSICFFEQSSICEFLCYIVEKHDVSQRTVKKYTQILHGFFDYLLKVKRIIDTNPVHDIPNMGTIKDEAAKPIPDRERQLLSTYMKEHDPQLWLVCQMEYYCAIRPNECRQLQIGDIDFDNHIITVPKDISKNRLTESVNIPRQLYDYIYKVLNLDIHPKEFYIFSHNGIPGKIMLGMNNFRFRFDRIRDKLNISTQYKLYSFKHTGGVKLVNEGIDTWELQRHFRHKSIDTTERYIRRNFAVKSDKIRNGFPDI